MTMEGKEKKNETMANKPNEVKMFKAIILVLVIIIGVLTVLLITSRSSLKEIANENQASTILNQQLETELDSLLNQYTFLKLEYDSVLFEKDSVIMASASEIRRLIAMEGDYYRIRRQLNLLRERTQDYVKELDSLYTENKVLKAENVKMREEIQVISDRTTELQQDKQMLSEKVEMASALKAFQISGTGVRLRGSNREEDTDRARRTDRIKICFNVAENMLAQGGKRTLYVRIAGPDNSILRLSDTDAHAFVHQGDTLQYSVKHQFDYNNRDTKVCVYWDKTGDFLPGSYLISIYSEENKLGESQFTLK